MGDTNYKIKKVMCPNIVKLNNPINIFPSTNSSKGWGVLLKTFTETP